MLFFNFCLFLFSKFQMAIVKNLIMDFDCTQEVLIRHKYFQSTRFYKETTALLNFFEICTEMHFVSLFFLNERNISIFLVMIHLKCTVVHYFNLNSSSLNKPFLNYGPLNMFFFSISYLRLFQRGFCQENYEVTIFFQYKFPKFISRCSILQNIRMSYSVILKWRHFEHKAKFKKMASFLQVQNRYF